MGEPEKKVLTVDDYGRWNRIESAVMSPDGNWMTYAYSPAEGDKTFYIRNLQSDDQPREIKFGSSPVFSDDSKWLAYRVGISEEETKKLQKSKKPIVPTLELLNLESGDKSTYKGGASATFSDAANFVAISMRSGESSSGKGADLLLIDLATNAVRNIGNVASFAFNKPGDMIAYTVATANDFGNGLYVLELKSNVLRPIDSSDSEYAQMRWNEDGDRLAVLRGKEKDGFTRKFNDLIVVANVGSRSEAKSIYTPEMDDSFPDDMVVSELSRLSFSKDGSMSRLVAHRSRNERGS